MESKPENSMISPTENSVPPPSWKRQKTLSDKHAGGQRGDASQQVVMHKNDKSDRGRNEQSASHPPIVLAKPSKPRKRGLGKKIGAFAAQCAKCRKWRLISTKEKYEEIREQALNDPFVCEKAREWKPDVTCDDPSDISQDRGLWAIDKPNIARTPQGWERSINIRSEGSTKFADVHYWSPTGTQLRSSKELEKYLEEHPECAAQGVNISHFSFSTPAPLRKDYVRKRSQTSQSGVTTTGSTKLLPLEEVQPISWVPPLADGNPENNM